MSTYLVAGGVFQDLDGNELFSLVCPAPGELPYVFEGHLSLEPGENQRLR